MGGRERAAVQLPAAVMVLTAARVLLLTLAALGASGQGQIPLGKPRLTPKRTGLAGGLGSRLLGIRGLFAGACGAEKAGSGAEAQEMGWASGVPAAAV